MNTVFYKGGQYPERVFVNEKVFVIGRKCSVALLKDMKAFWDHHKYPDHSFDP